MSEACSASLNARGTFFSMPKRQTIYNGVTVHPNSGAFGKDPKLSGKKKLLMLASYEERKGHDFALRVLQKVKASIPDIELVFCGDGTNDEFINVERLIEKI